VDDVNPMLPDDRRERNGSADHARRTVPVTRRADRPGNAGSRRPIHERTSGRRNDTRREPRTIETADEVHDHAVAAADLFRGGDIEDALRVALFIQWVELASPSRPIPIRSSKVPSIRDRWRGHPRGSLAQQSEIVAHWVSSSRLRYQTATNLHPRGALRACTSNGFPGTMADCRRAVLA
jgi:hypothetical protein